MLLSKLTFHSLKFKNTTYSLLTVSLAKNRYFSKNQSTNRGMSKAMATEEQVLQIPQGMIKGLKRKTIYDHHYYSFEGIPYGRPPVGELRFKAPLPAENWTDIKDCRDSKIKPLQKNHNGEIEGSEDCLYLNVYAKTLQAPEKLPVMVYIYGGAYNTGSCVRSKFGPDYFMEEDVLVVTLNYRLSSLGYLSLSDPECEVPGNAGLKDQVLALKWVKDNIKHFGGDTNNITLFGESAGASSVHYMLATTEAKNLFHKAICMSGCILNNWAFSGDSTGLSYRLACDKGYKGLNEDKLVLEYLRKLPAAELVDLDNLNAEAATKGGFCAFIPSLEPYDSEGSIIRKSLKEILKSSWGNDIPIMIGGTSFEGLVRYSRLKQKPDVMELYHKNPQMFLPEEVKKLQTKETQLKLIEKLKDVHFKNCEEIMAFMDYSSYFAFWHGFHRFIKSRQLCASADTYQYLFDFDSPTFNHHRKMFCGDDITTGVAHADDLSYIWYSFYSWKLEKDSKEYLTIKRMIKLWTNFAKTSNPNCEYTKESDWKTLNESNEHQLLRIADELAFEEMSEEVRNKLNVWNSLYGDELL